MNSTILAIGMPGPWEIALLFLIVLLFFGASKLPQLARSIGSSLTEFKKGKLESEGDQAAIDTPKTEEEKPEEGGTA